jgi:hypothetical protein
LRLQTRPQAACAKQSQFPGHGRDGRGTHGRDARATERLAASPRLRGDDIATNRVSAPNKPNFGPGKMKGKCCANRELRQVGCENGPGKTKPISRLRIADCGLGDGPAASGLLRAVAPNKPNSRVMAGTAVVFMGETPMLRNALRHHYERGCCVKQTQFRPAAKRGKCSRRQGLQTIRPPEGLRKQSQ